MVLGQAVQALKLGMISELSERKQLLPLSTSSFFLCTPCYLGSHSDNHTSLFAFWFSPKTT